MQASAHTNFLPSGAVTGIGSLPLDSAAAAIQAVARFSPDIPFWPQLPRLSEREKAVGQGLGVLAELIEPRTEGYGYRVKEGRLDAVLGILHRSNGELTSENAAGFSALEHGRESRLFPSAVAVKGQIEGPITLAAYLFHKDRPFLAEPSLFAAIAFHVSQIVNWQIDRLKVFGLPVLMFLDEPALCLEAPAGTTVSEDRRLSALAVTLDGARIRGAVAGLHCCAASPFDRMCRVGPDILSFDAHEGLELFFAHQGSLHFAQRGGIVAYGMIPTARQLDDVDPVAIFTRWLTAASIAGDPQELAQRAMITATCGLGLLDPTSVPESFRAARAVGKFVRGLANGG